MNKVSDRFIHFLKTVRQQAKINTRELAQAADKSNAYVSILENGKIKTIDFSTAYKMLDYINKKKPFISVDNSIYELLTEHFSIYPKDYWEKLLQQQELQEQAKLKELERIGDKLDLISSLIQDENLVDLLLRIVQSDFYMGDLNVLNTCVSMLKNTDESKILKEFINKECEPVWLEREK